MAKKKLSWVTTQRKVNDLLPLDINPRKISAEKKKALILSIEKFNLAEIPAINKDNTIIAGHQRMKALQMIGRGNELIDVRIPNRKLSDKEVKEYNLLSNTHAGEWDLDLFDEYFADVNLDSIGLKIEDIKIPDLNDLIDTKLEAHEDNYQPPAEIITDIVLGDLFKIGEHRLLCGDSTDSDQVAKLMNGAKADMVFTDPPYRIETEGGCKGNIGKSLKKLGKEIKFISDFNPLDFLQNLPLVFKKNKLNAYIFCNKELLPDYLIWARDSGYSFNVLIWKKPNAIPIGDSHWPDIEYLLLFRKSAIWNNGLQNVNYSRCLEFGREKGLHPTMKPIELISNEMLISSNKGSLILDFFIGSGSTMVAAHQLKRKCYAMEITPKYCQVIVDRMRKLDPDIKILRNGKEF